VIFSSFRRAPRPSPEAAKDVRHPMCLRVGASRPSPRDGVSRCRDVPCLFARSSEESSVVRPCLVALVSDACEVRSVTALLGLPNQPRPLPAHALTNTHIHTHTHIHAHIHTNTNTRVLDRKRDVFVLATTDVCSLVNWLARQTLNYEKEHEHMKHTHTRCIWGDNIVVLG